MLDPGGGGLTFMPYRQRPRVASRGKPPHTSHLLLQGGVLGLQPQQLSVHGAAGGGVGCGSSPFLQAAVLLLQLLDLRAQLRRRRRRNDEC